MATNDKSSSKPSDPAAADKPSDPTAGASADAQTASGTTNTQAAARPEVEPYSTTTADAVDPVSGEKFAAPAGWKGRYGFETLEATGAVVPAVDPAAIPSEAAPSVTPDSGGDQLMAAAQAKAPNLTREFCDAYGLGDDVIAAIARGEIPPPPTIGPNHSSDLYLTPGGWVSTPPGVPIEQAGGNAIAR